MTVSKHSASSQKVGEFSSDSQGLPPSSTVFRRVVKRVKEKFLGGVPSDALVPSAEPETKNERFQREADDEMRVQGGSVEHTLRYCYYLIGSNPDQDHFPDPVRIRTEGALQALEYIIRSEQVLSRTFERNPEVFFPDGCHQERFAIFHERLFFLKHVYHYLLYSVLLDAKSGPALQSAEKVLLESAYNRLDNPHLLEALKKAKRARHIFGSLKNLFSGWSDADSQSDYDSQVANYETSSTCVAILEELLVEQGELSDSSILMDHIGNLIEGKNGIIQDLKKAHKLLIYLRGNPSLDPIESYRIERLLMSFSRPDSARLPHQSPKLEALKGKVVQLSDYLEENFKGMLRTVLKEVAPMIDRGLKAFINFLSVRDVEQRDIADEALTNAFRFVLNKKKEDFSEFPHHKVVLENISKQLLPLVRRLEDVKNLDYYLSEDTSLLQISDNEFSPLALDSEIGQSNLYFNSSLHLKKDVLVPGAVDPLLTIPRINFSDSVAFDLNKQKITPLTSGDAGSLIGNIALLTVIAHFLPRHLKQWSRSLSERVVSGLEWAFSSGDNCLESLGQYQRQGEEIKASCYEVLARLENFQKQSKFSDIEQSIIAKIGDTLKDVLLDSRNKDQSILNDIRGVDGSHEKNLGFFKLSPSPTSSNNGEINDFSP